MQTHVLALGNGILDNETRVALSNYIGNTPTEMKPKMLHNRTIAVQSLTNPKAVSQKRKRLTTTADALGGEDKAITNVHSGGGGTHHEV